MHRWAKLASLAVLAGCGSGPQESTIYHDPALRPGVIEANDATERELLVRLAVLEAETSIELGGRTFAAGAPYHAASGRRCIHVVEADTERLACSTSDEGPWVFVPIVVSGAP